MALAAMAFCYFLTPQFAWGYAIVAVIGYVSLAVPAVAGGPCGVAGRRLMDASPGREHLPGGTWYTLRLAGTLLAVFALPAAVAAALPAPISERSTEPWVALGCLLGTAGAFVAAVRLAGLGRSRFAGRAAVAAPFFILAATAALAILPVLPSLPEFWSN
jgi:hypothetical protein